MKLLDVLIGLEDEMKDLTPEEATAVRMVFTFAFTFYDNIKNGKPKKGVQGYEQ